MTPQIASALEGEIVEYRQPSRTYRNSGTQVAGKTDGLDAVMQSARHILATERCSERIYGDNYGVELAQYVGQDYGYLVAGIEETLRDALLQDDRITGVRVDGVEKVGGKADAARVAFSVFSIFGNYEDEIDVMR